MEIECSLRLRKITSHQAANLAKEVPGGCFASYIYWQLLEEKISPLPVAILALVTPQLAAI